MVVMPSLILFDEPFSALDTPLRKKLAMDIREIQKKTQFTGIIVTHDEDEAKSISDRIIKIEKGRLIYDSDSSQKP
jgi:ABC-type proline/glycine betaine transport system ATPase subunit